MTDNLFTPKLISTDISWRPPLYDLTPTDLLQAGWAVQPHFDVGSFVARQENEFGGSHYSPPFKSVDTLIDYVRTVYIQKERWVGKFG